MSNRRPATYDSQTERPRDMPIYRQYFDLIASGEKTVEARVAYESMKRIKPGDMINFTCRESSSLARVTRIGTYAPSRRRSAASAWRPSTTVPPRPNSSKRSAPSSRPVTRCWACSPSRSSGCTRVSPVRRDVLALRLLR